MCRSVHVQRLARAGCTVGPRDGAASRPLGGGAARILRGPTARTTTTTAAAAAAAAAATAYVLRGWSTGEEERS